MRIFDLQKIKDSAVIFILLLWGIMCRAENVEFRYWFNQNADNAEIVTSTPGSSSISIPYNAEKCGLVNVLNIQVRNSTGLWSVPYRYLFNPPQSGDLKFEYIIDNNNPKSLVNNSIDVSDVNSGFHKLLIVDKNQAIPPATGVFYNNTSSKQNLKLTFSSVKNRVKKEAVINDSDGECILNVSNLTPGLYPVSIAITDTVSGALVALSNANVEIKAPTGNRSLL